MLRFDNFHIRVQDVLYESVNGQIFSPRSVYSGTLLIKGIAMYPVKNMLGINLIKMKYLKLWEEASQHEHVAKALYDHISMGGTTEARLMVSSIIIRIALAYEFKRRSPPGAFPDPDHMHMDLYTLLPLGGKYMNLKRLLASGSQEFNIMSSSLKMHLDEELRALGINITHMNLDVRNGADACKNLVFLRKDVTTPNFVIHQNLLSSHPLCCCLSRDRCIAVHVRARIQAYLKYQERSESVLLNILKMPMECIGVQS